MIQFIIHYVLLTVSVVFAKVWSLVPTFTVNVPGSTTHVFLSDQTANWDERTLMETVVEPPALLYCISRRNLPQPSLTYGMLTLEKPTSS